MVKTVHSKHEVLNIKLLALPYDILMTAAVFAQSFHIYERASEKICREHDLTQSQFTALWCMLLLNRPLQPTEISRLLSIETSSVTTLIDYLEKRSMVQRDRVQHDRRAVEITLTAKGKEFITLAAPLMRDLITGIYSIFSKEELSQFVLLLKKIRESSIKVIGNDITYLEDHYQALFQPLLSTRIKSQTKRRSTPNKPLK